jgi:DNA-binding NarL/FixJ family response regulator
MSLQDGKALRILIAEDHELTRNGLIYSFKELSDFEIVGDAQNGEAALSMVDRLHPNVVLMDIGLPVMDGIEVTQRLKAKYPEIRVIMLTSRQQENEVLAALAAGADAYCLKDIATERLIQVIQMVGEGAFWLDPSIARSVLNIIRPRLPHTKTGEFPRHGGTQYRGSDLTDREMEVLSLLVEGKNNKEISERLEITVNTVKAHVASIIQKMAVDDRTQAALKALREGLLTQ